MSWVGLDSASDYIDVEYSIDEGAWTQVANQVGGGPHTIEYLGFDTGDASATVPSGAIASGANKLNVSVCANFDSFQEYIRIEEVRVPEAGVTVLTPATAPTVTTTALVLFLAILLL
ncbi:hypothetical protein [Lutibacter sp. Hel_I_33_5]|uniref:hypothetical protein n=1 Tax=Lutibacter sp. Hel_I_33_5 TaxID=1566289 RepID=UPI0011A330B3|nr:hypothetical protein [Lutibacter sp. Hel_I_33_5]